MKNLTIEELLRLPEGTKIRIKKEVDCSDLFKKEGFVTVQERTSDKKEYCYGIVVPGFGACYYFHVNDYELI